MKYAFPKHDAELMAATFEDSVGEMAVTTILVNQSGYSWRQSCPWPEELLDVQYLGE